MTLSPPKIERYPIIAGLLLASTLLYAEDEKLGLKKGNDHPAATAVMAPKGIDIDGDLKDWPKTNKITPLNNDAIENFGAAIYVMYDKDSLYVGGTVNLDYAKPKVPNPKRWWLSDCVEIWVDTKNSKPHMKMQSEHHQIIFTPATETHPATLGQVMYAGQYAGSGVSSGIVWIDKKDDAKWASKTSDGGYTFEIQLKGKHVLREFDPEVSHMIGFNISIDSGVAKRLYWVTDKSWPGDASKATYAWSNPELWGNVMLSRKMSAAKTDEINALIQKLGAADFKTRRAAKEKLKAFGPYARALLEAHRDDDDVEIRLTIRKLLKN